MKATLLLCALASTSLAPAHPAPGAAAGTTPAERAIAVARRGVTNAPQSVEAHVALATALSRRARETADPVWYDRSDEALDASLELAPEHFGAARMRVWNQLGRHEFEDALAGALALHERAKDDVATYGLLVDAQVELGRYADAEESAQWMLNLRPGTPAAMTRVSYLRELFGDVPGAIDAMRAAFHSTRPSEAEDRAWMLTHLAHLELERGRTDAAEGYATGALELFDDYHYALKELARVRSAQGRHADALALLQRRYVVAPHPENLYDAAEAAAEAGDAEAAREMFERFESLALEETGSIDNANLELVEYWLERVGDDTAIERALDLASRRAERRCDVATLASLAWAQHRAGQHAEALATIDEVVAVGWRSPKVRLRAGLIARANGDVERASAELEIAWQQAPKSRAGEAASAALRDLGR
ncbi:MAG: tetratricopeptide repeat protein [Planctomycetota bacterium]